MKNPIQPKAAPTSRGPLSGLRVLELATLLPGPFCGLILSELGAAVTKVEPPGGDPARRYPPLVAGVSALFTALNRGKRCVVLDLKSRRDLSTFLRMASRADIVIEGSRPGTARRLGVDYATLRRQNPRLIYASISGHGQTGPRARRPGHDLTFQAWAGTLGRSGGPGGEPAMPAVQIADLAGGALPAVIAILAALFDRERTGKGTHLDISMADGLRALTLLHHARFAASKGHPRPTDDVLSGQAPCYRIYATRDGHVAVGALEAKFWEGFCRAIGAPDLLPHAFSGPAVVRRVQSILRRRTTREWMRWFDSEGTCVEPVREPAEVCAAEGGAPSLLKALPAWTPTPRRAPRRSRAPRGRGNRPA